MGIEDEGSKQIGFFEAMVIAQNFDTLGAVAVRKSERFTQEALGRKVGVSGRTIGRWEDGGSSPRHISDQYVEYVKWLVNHGYNNLREGGVEENCALDWQI